MPRTTDYFIEIVLPVRHIGSGKLRDASQGVIKMGATVSFTAYMAGGVGYAKQDNTLS